MNTIARVINLESIKAHGKNSLVHVTKKNMLVSLLILILFVSAFAIVYMKDLNRRLFIQYQSLQREKAQQVVEWGRLLLEQSTWSTQSRIAQIAQHQLGMEIPDAKDVVLVEVHHAANTIR
jgi:cell division protein FtsL